MFNMQRFREPSSWAGIAAIAQGLKFVMPPQWHQALDGVTMAAGAIAFGKKDPGTPQ